MPEHEKVATRHYAFLAGRRFARDRNRLFGDEQELEGEAKVG